MAKPMTFEEFEEITISLENDLKIFNQFLIDYDDFHNEYKFIQLDSAFKSLNSILERTSSIRALRHSQLRRSHEARKLELAHNTLSAI